jgi:hypothetical protein
MELRGTPIDVHKSYRDIDVDFERWKQESIKPKQR